MSVLGLLASVYWCLVWHLDACLSLICVLLALLQYASQLSALVCQHHVVWHPEAYLCFIGNIMFSLGQ